MKTDEVMNRLRLMHNPQQWAFFEELRIGTGFGKDAEQRLDAWAIHFYPSKRNVSRTYELKVSRSDFNKEMSQPLKRRPGLRLANEFYFVTPQNLVKPEEIPPECGLMEVREDGAVQTTIPAPFRDVHPPTWLFMASVCRRKDGEFLSKYNDFIEMQKQMYLEGKIAQDIIFEHIDRWENFNQGNKEVPDQIADALKKVSEEIKAALEANRYI